jgi:DinB superfamily
MNDNALREHIVNLLGGEGAHLSFDDAIAGLPKEFRGKKPDGVPHTPWRLLEHMRIAQHDILNFCTNPKYKEMKWPEDYWPKGDGPESGAEWKRSVESFHGDLEQMKALVSDSKTDLFAKIPWGDGQTYLREALLVADHNAYHVGELVAVRRALARGNE